MLDHQPDSQDRSTAPPDLPAGDAPTVRAHPVPSQDEPDPTLGDWPADGGDLGRMQAVIDSLPEAVFVTEPDGELRHANPAADRLFASQPIHDQADLLSRFEEITPEGSRRRMTGTSTEELRDPVTVRPHDQPNRWYALRTVDLDPAHHASNAEASEREAIPAGAHPGPTVFVLRDVTDSRDLQPVREAFLAILSHELRTPITTIYAGSSVLARHPNIAEPAMQTLARDISAEAARLYALVEDLLVLARLERSVLEPQDEPVLVQRAVESAVRRIGDRRSDEPIDRRGDTDLPPVRGDATYVEQACRNLLLSAVRYAGPEPDRRLAVDLRAHPNAGEVTVAVLDRGPALSAADLERAFELPDASALGRLAGAGVGSFVCRHLVEAMGGRVWARNRTDGPGLEMGFALRIDARG